VPIDSAIRLGGNPCRRSSAARSFLSIASWMQSRFRPAARDARNRVVHERMRPPAAATHLDQKEPLKSRGSFLSKTSGSALLLVALVVLFVLPGPSRFTA
jgi:hypothetical protein